MSSIVCFNFVQDFAVLYEGQVKFNTSGGYLVGCVLPTFPSGHPSFIHQQ
jgi:hypothetical protein